MKTYKQLRKAGADQEEAKELAVLASRLQASIPNPAPHLPSATKKAMFDELGVPPKRAWFEAHRMQLAGASLALLFLATVVVAQFTQPSSPIYSVKQATDEIRSVLQPGFKKQEPIKPIIEDSTDDSQIHGSDDSNDTFDDSDNRIDDDNSGHGSDDASDDNSGHGGDDSSDDSSNSGSSHGGSSDDTNDDSDNRTSDSNSGSGHGGDSSDDDKDESGDD